MPLPLSPRQNAIVMLCSGVGLIVLAGAGARSCHDHYASAVVTEGTVVGLNHGPHHAEVEYTSADGETRSFPDNTVFGREVGERVPVTYFPRDNPEGYNPEEQTADFNGMYGFPVMIAGAGLVCALGGAAYLVWLRRRARRSRAAP